MKHRLTLQILVYQIIVNIDYKLRILSAINYTSENTQNCGQNLQNYHNYKQFYVNGDKTVIKTKNNYPINKNNIQIPCYTVRKLEDNTNTI